MQELYPLNGEETLFFKTLISFVDHLQESLSALLIGCTLVIPPSKELKVNVFSIVDFIQVYFPLLGAYSGLSRVFPSNNKGFLLLIT